MPFKRCVFYIPGFDPKAPRKYREIYRYEAQKQSAILNYDISIKPLFNTEFYGWSIASNIDDISSESDFFILNWADLVKENLKKSLFYQYISMLRTSWIYISTGVLFRLMQLRKGPVIGALYPPVLLSLQALLGGGIVLLPLLYLPFFLALIIGVILARVWFYFCQKLDKTLYTHYLMAFFGFITSKWGAIPPEINSRLARFEAEIEKALTKDYDEILIIGHSAGSILSIHLLARLLRQHQSEFQPALSFLSLANVSPMMSFLPNAHELRRDLKEISGNSRITWIDISSTYDGASFALCEPLAVTGLAHEAQIWPRMIAVNFTKSLSKEQIAHQKYRFYERHFQFLKAFERPQHYDYFQITGGGLTLYERYQSKKESPSVKRKRVSYYHNV